MEQKDLVFLSLDGTIKTTTGAQRIKDAAGSYVANLKAELEAISFVNQTVKAVGTKDEDILSKGWASEQLALIQAKLNKIIEAQSLQAWLGEAIAAKTRLQDALNRISTEEFAALYELEMPTAPEMPDYMSQDEWLATLSVKERNEFLKLDTICAVYGNFIHPNRPFEKAKKELFNRVAAPTAVTQSFGSTVLIYKYTPSMSVTDVERAAFELQNIYNENQARLNGFKNRYKIAADKKYNQEFQEYKIAHEQYKVAYREMQTKVIEYKREQQEAFDKLKIVIPNDLKGIYNIIKALGKHEEE